MRSTRRPLDPVTFAEAAHILGVTPSTIRRHVIGGCLKITPAEQIPIEYDTAKGP